MGHALKRLRNDVGRTSYMLSPCGTALSCNGSHDASQSRETRRLKLNVFYCLLVLRLT